MEENTVTVKTELLLTEEEFGLISRILDIIIKEVYRSGMCFAGRGPRTSDSLVSPTPKCSRASQITR